MVAVTSSRSPSWRAGSSARFHAFFKGGNLGLEQMDQANASLVVDHLHGNRRRQLRHHGVWATARLGGLFATPAALPFAVQRPLYVRAALYCERTWRAAGQGIGKKA